MLTQNIKKWGESQREFLLVLCFLPGGKLIMLQDDALVLHTFLSQMFPLLLVLLFCTISCATVTMSNDVLPVHA